MLDFLIFSLATIGLTFIITLSYLFKNVRIKAKILNQSLGKLLSCSQCTGFWSGVLIRLVQLFHLNLNLDIEILLYGFIGSFISYIAYLLMKPLIDKYD